MVAYTEYLATAVLVSIYDRHTSRGVQSGGGGSVQHTFSVGFSFAVKRPMKPSFWLPFGERDTTPSPR